MPNDQSSLCNYRDAETARLSETCFRQLQEIIALKNRLTESVPRDRYEAAMCRMSEMVARAAQANQIFNRQQLSNPRMRLVSELIDELPPELPISRQAAHDWCLEGQIVAEFCNGRWFALPQSFYSRVVKVARRRGVRYEPPTA